MTYVLGSGVGARIVNGLPTTWYPSVGALLYRERTLFESFCTATLIGCNTALTAAHCVAEDEDVRNYRMFFQHAGLVNIKAVDWQKRDYREPAPNGGLADIAVITLEQPVTGVAPSPINDDREHAPNVPGTIVGFGRTGGQASDSGLKRFGAVKSAECGAGFAKNEFVCWNYEGRDSNTCNGDSGGPLLWSQNANRQVVSGVTSGGRNPTCLSSDHSFDTSVFRYANWVKAVVGSDLDTKACGSEAPIGNDPKRYRPFSGQLSAARPLHVFEVKVKGAKALRVGVNTAKFAGADPEETKARPQLFVTKGRDRSKATRLCEGDPAVAAAAFCSISNPEEDQIYSIVLERAENQGRAEFQIVMSVF